MLAASIASALGAPEGAIKLLLSIFIGNVTEYSSWITILLTSYVQ